MVIPLDGRLVRCSIRHGRVPPEDSKTLFKRNSCTGRAQAIKKEANNLGLLARKPLAEVHGNRTHLPPSSDGTPDLKSGDDLFAASSSL